MFADQTTIPLIALYRSATDPAVTYTDGRVTAGILWLDTSTGDTGTLKKRNEADSGWDTLIDLDGAPPAAHASSHENGGPDELDLTGMSGLLATPQTPASHAHTSSDISDFGEAVEDKIGAKVVAGTGISVAYNDTTGETTVSNSDPGSGSSVTDEHVQDVVGALFADGDVDLTYDDAGNTETNIVRKASENFALPGDISPSQITANQNDYNPTGLSTASTLRLSTDASRNVTGLQGGADGRILIIHNVGSNNIVFKDDDSGSSAANRFALNADVTLAADECLTFQYDSTSSRWRMIGGTRPTGLVVNGGALGTPASGNLSNCTADGTDEVGFRNIPQNSKSAAYTTVLSDKGKHILHPSTDANARTFTIDSNANVAYPIGTAITFINMTSQVVTIAITSDTMNLAGTGTTGSRSLAQYGVATAIKIGTTLWIISGTGLT